MELILIYCNIVHKPPLTSPRTISILFSLSRARTHAHVSRDLFLLGFRQNCYVNSSLLLCALHSLPITLIYRCWRSYFWWCQQKWWQFAPPWQETWHANKPNARRKKKKSWR
jgi:hypothetical protein